MFLHGQDIYLAHIAAAHPAVMTSYIAQKFDSDRLKN